MYLVSIDRAAAKVLLGFPEKDQLRIRDRIDALAANPRPVDCKKLQGEDGLYRIRSGDYRVVYAIRDKQLLVLVVRIGDRKDVYRD